MKEKKEMSEVKVNCLTKLIEIENQLKDIKIKIDKESFEEALMLCSKTGLNFQNISTLLLNRYLDKE